MSKYLPIGLLLGWLLSLSVHAVGLGPLEIHSSLNQPFAASIRLFALGSVPLSNLQAQSADEEYYQRAKLDRTLSASKLNFEVTRSRGGEPIIWITSDDRITDLYLEVLLELSWPEGRTYRAYTILLDPSDYKTTTNHPSSLPQTQAPQSQSANQLTATDPVPTISGSGSSDNYSSDTGGTSTDTAFVYGPVQSGQALWNIVQEVKPSSGVTIQQTMLAIVGLNPKAFINGNVNGLKAGYQLKIPNLETIQSISDAAALQEVEQHDKAWQQTQPIEHSLQPPYTSNDVREDSEPSSAENNAAEQDKQADTAEKDTTAQTADPQDAFDTSEIQQVPTPKPEPATAAQTPEIPAFAPLASATQPQDPKLNDFSFIDLEKNTGNDSTALAVLRAELLETAVTVNTLTETNLGIQQQFEQLQEQNQQLQTQLTGSNDEIALLKTQLVDILKSSGQTSSNSQATLTPAGTDRPYIKLMLLAIISLGLAAMLGWRIYQARANEALDIDDNFAPPAADSSHDDKENFTNSAEIRESTISTPVADQSPPPPLADDFETGTPDESNRESVPSQQESSDFEPELPDENKVEQTLSDETDTPQTPQEQATTKAEIFIPDVPAYIADDSPAMETDSESVSSPQEKPFTNTDDEPIKPPSQEQEQTQEQDTLKFTSYSEENMQLDKKDEPPATEESAATEVPSEEDIKSFTDQKQQDTITTKLDLAKTYIEMGESNDARQLLEEVIKEGNEEQMAAAKELLQQIKSDPS